MPCKSESAASQKPAPEVLRAAGTKKRAKKGRGGGSVLRTVR